MPTSRPILVVDDDQRDIELITAAFASCRIENPIDVTDDPLDALDYLYRRGDYSARRPASVAVVLLDIKMPKISGIEVLKVIKTDPELHDTPVIMMSSSMVDGDLSESYHLGANGYIVKPTDFEEYVKTVCSLGIFWGHRNATPPFPGMKVAHLAKSCGPHALGRTAQIMIATAHRAALDDAYHAWFDCDAGAEELFYREKQSGLLAVDVERDFVTYLAQIRFPFLIG